MNALVLLFIATVWLRKISTLPKLYFLLTTYKLAKDRRKEYCY